MLFKIDCINYIFLRDFLADHKGPEGRYGPKLARYVACELCKRWGIDKYPKNKRYARRGEFNAFARHNPKANELLAWGIEAGPEVIYTMAKTAKIFGKFEL